MLPLQSSIAMAAMQSTQSSFLVPFQMHLFDPLLCSPIQ